MNTKMSLVLLGLVALAVASEPPKDNYDEEQGGYGEEPRGYESREAARQRNPYYGGPYYMGDNPNNYPPRHQTREYRGGRYYYGGTYKGKILSHLPGSVVCTREGATTERGSPVT